MVTAVESSMRGSEERTLTGEVARRADAGLTRRRGRLGRGTSLPRRPGRARGDGDATNGEPDDDRAAHMPVDTTERASIRGARRVDLASPIIQQPRMPARLVLASASPRRAELLARLGIPFVVRPSDVPEVPAPGESGPSFARRAAREKAAAAAVASPGEWILAADTIVLLDDEILGKPAGADDARRMLGLLSGRAHRVVTALVLLRPDGSAVADLAVETAVAFRDLSAAEIDAYVAGGEPLDKAGAYAIQGGAAEFVVRLTGSHTNVIGLPMEELSASLERCGFEMPSPVRDAAHDRQ